MANIFENTLEKIEPDSFDEGLGWLLLLIGGGLLFTRKPKAIIGGIALALLGAYID